MSIALSLPDPQSINHWWLKLQFTTKRRIGFYRDMENATRAGIAPYHAIERMRDVSRPRRSLRWLVNLLDPFLLAMKEGRKFAQALSEWVPAEDAAMIAAGEEMGNLPDALKKLVELLENKRQITTSLRKNILPSCLLLVIASVMMVYISNNIGPQAKKMVPDHIMETLSFLPHYIAFGEFLQEWGVVIAVTMLTCIALVWWSLPRWRPSPIRSWLDQKLLPWSFVARLQSVFFLISISSMMQAGRTFTLAIEQMVQHASPWTEDYLNQMRRRLAQGKEEVVAMQVAMLPQDVADRLNFYAILPNFTYVMQETARDAMVGLIIATERVGSILRTLALLMLALFILSTMYSMYDMSFALERASGAAGGSY